MVREPDLEIIQASANAASFLHLDKAIGCRLDEIDGDLGNKLRPHLDQPMDLIPIVLRCRLGRPAAHFDVMIHRPPGGSLIIEVEPAGPAVNVAAFLEASLRQILEASSLNELCNLTARLFKELTGYDRVMVYRFDEAGHGEVFSERREAHLEAYLGNRYPASDIPQMARRLYERNRVRVLVDVGYQPIPLTPAQSTLTGKDLDMSLCVLR
ncbi:MAG: GAF domain-containing protein, partial [Kiloniellaceae bacterium]